MNKNLETKSIFNELEIALNKIKSLPINKGSSAVKCVYTYNT